MEYVQLGNSGLTVSRAAIGGIPIGSGGGFEKIAGVDADGARRQIDELLDRGGNFIDTANQYSAGDSERVIGEALRNRRDDVVLASKGSVQMGDGPNDGGSTRVNLTRTIEESLQRLNTDHVDLYYVHRWDGLTPIRETIMTMNNLIRQGKIRYWGVSNFSAWQLTKTAYEARALGLEEPIAHQAYYTVEARELEYEIIPAARDLGMATVVWSPLGEGLLNGKVRRGRKTPPDTRQGTGWPEPMPVDMDRAYDIIELLDEIAQELGWTIPQVAISWLMPRPGVSAVIVAARDQNHLVDDLDATERRLPDEVQERLTRATQLPTYYPWWHRMTQSKDRLEPAEKEFYEEFAQNLDL